MQKGKSSAFRKIPEMKGSQIAGNGHVLGLDISSSCIGWADFNIEDKVLIAYGKIVIPKGDNIFEKMVYGSEEVKKIMEGRNVLSIGVEELNCFRGGNITRVLLMMAGAVCFTLYNMGLEPNFINTSTIKSKMKASPLSTENISLCNVNTIAHAKRSKWIMCHRVNEMFLTTLLPHSDKKKSGDDIADAIAVGKTLLDEISGTEF